MQNTDMIAEAFPPGDFLKEELEERGWTQGDLATVLGKSQRLVNEVINAKRSITPETARALGAAFGTSASYWMNLESSWQLFQTSSSSVDDVGRRGILYDQFPVKEMIKRGWIESSESVGVLETRFCEFFQIGSIKQSPRLSAAFRRSNDKNSNIQLAWLYRAYQVASKLSVDGRFNKTNLDKCFTGLRSLLEEPIEIRKIGRILSAAGIRFIVVEPFSSSFVDGVCFWLDSKSPVVAVSLRIGRIDNFWFTLLHELRHVANGDGQEMPVVDEKLCEEEPTSRIEKKANRESAEFLISSEKFANFVARTSPMYSFDKIVGFARVNNIHPGIVVGRLQKLDEVPWTHFRKYLVDIREYATQSTVTDGWGFSPP